MRFFCLLRIGLAMLSKGDGGFSLASLDALARALWSVVSGYEAQSCTELGDVKE